MSSERLAVVTFSRHAEVERSHALATRLVKQGYVVDVRGGPHARVSLGGDQSQSLSYEEASVLLDGLERRVSVRFKRIREAAILPSWGSMNAVGLDLHACLDEPLRLKPGESVLVPTGWAFECPPGCYARIAPRSGMSTKGFLVNAGVVDADFRGEVKVLLAFLGAESSPEIHPGDRVAQVIFERAVLAQAFETLELTDSIRGSGAWGSTGN